MPLRILRHKGYNPYGQKQRARVNADEAKESAERRGREVEKRIHRSVAKRALLLAKASQQHSVRSQQELDHDTIRSSSLVGKVCCGDVGNEGVLRHGDDTRGGTERPVSEAIPGAISVAASSKPPEPRHATFIDAQRGSMGELRPWYASPSERVSRMPASAQAGMHSSGRRGRNSVQLQQDRHRRSRSRKAYLLDEYQKSTQDPLTAMRFALGPASMTLLPMDTSRATSMLTPALQQHNMEKQWAVPAMSGIDTGNEDAHVRSVGASTCVEKTRKSTIEKNTRKRAHASNRGQRNMCVFETETGTVDKDYEKDRRRRSRRSERAKKRRKLEEDERVCECGDYRSESEKAAHLAQLREQRLLREQKERLRVAYAMASGR